MNHPPSLEEPPIARTKAGAPLAYASLGIAFHLEAFVPEDGERLTQACDRILAAIGPSLKWAWSSVHGEVEPFAPAVLDSIGAYPLQLANDAKAADPRARAGERAMTAAHYDKFGVACHGGPERNLASPTTLRFYATATAGADGEPVHRARAMLALTMPLMTPLPAFEALARALAGDLRIRWGVAGLTYGAWELDRYGETRDALYAHARRHPGFDIGQHATWMRELYDRVRTVSWLTFLGKDLTAKVKTRDALASDELVTVEPLGEGVVLRAGARPESGDVNQRRLPAAYVRADRRLRAVRASEDDALHFYAPWSASTTTAWLHRFEVAEPSARPAPAAPGKSAR